MPATSRSNSCPCPRPATASSPTSCRAPPTPALPRPPLNRRAGFGGSREEVAEAVKLGHEATLDLLLKGRPAAADTLPTLLDVGRTAASREDGGEQLRGWWLYAILHGGHPLREKMTLFWHNHFATSIAKVQNAYAMFRQNCLLRVHALGKFGPFLQAISQDGAILVWLDSNRNVKGK